jgi:hypothetical protein
MRRVKTWLISAALGLTALCAAPLPALAKPKIEWSKIQVPDGDSAARTTKLLKQALEQAARKANFGKKAKSVTLSARIVELKSELHGDVLQVSCTMMGRVVGAAGAKSKISYGGSPSARDELEKQVLTMVANGLVARLAQIARAEEAKIARPDEAN